MRFIIHILDRVALKKGRVMFFSDYDSEAINSHSHWVLLKEEVKR